MSGPRDALVRRLRGISEMLNDEAEFTLEPRLANLLTDRVDELDEIAEWLLSPPWTAPPWENEEE